MFIFGDFKFNDKGELIDDSSKYYFTINNSTYLDEIDNKSRKKYINLLEVLKSLVKKIKTNLINNKIFNYKVYICHKLYSKSFILDVYNSSKDKNNIYLLFYCRCNDLPIKISYNINENLFDIIEGNPNEYLNIPILRKLFLTTRKKQEKYYHNYNIKSISFFEKSKNTTNCLLEKEKLLRIGFDIIKDNININNIPPINKVLFKNFDKITHTGKYYSNKKMIRYSYHLDLNTIIHEYMHHIDYSINPIYTNTNLEGKNLEFIELYDKIYDTLKKKPTLISLKKIMNKNINNSEQCDYLYSQLEVFARICTCYLLLKTNNYNYNGEKYLFSIEEILSTKEYIERMFSLI